MRTVSLRLAQLTGVAALALFAVAGCSEKLTTGKVKGKVTFKGQPVTEGSVTFLNLTAGGTAGGDLKSDGTYEFGDVVVGDYVVVITPPVVMMDTDPGKSPPAPVEKNMPNIPAKFRMQGSTPLKASVKTGDNEFPFDLKP